MNSAGRPARRRLVGGRREPQDPGEVRLGDDVEHVVGETLQLALALVERPLPLDAVGDVPDEGEDRIRVVRDDPPLEHAPAGRDVERVLDDLDPAAVEAAADRLHPDRGRRGREDRGDRGTEEGLARGGERLRPRGVDRLVAAVPPEDEEEVGQRLEEGAVPPLALAQGLLRPAALDGEGHLRRDEAEERLVLLAVPQVSGVALDREDPDRPVACPQRHAQPVDRGGPDRLHLAARHEGVEDLRRGEQRLPLPEDVARQPAPDRDRPRGGLGVDLVAEVGKREAAGRVVQERDVEVSGLHQPRDDPVDPGVEVVQPLARRHRLGDRVRRLLDAPLAAVAVRPPADRGIVAPHAPPGRPDVSRSGTPARRSRSRMRLFLSSPARPDGRPGGPSRDGPARGLDRKLIYNYILI